MKENTWISIITPTLNCAKTIEYCIQSISNQEYKYVEHIIVDGNSSDGTIEKIKASSFSGKLIIGSDSGIYAAINKGIKEAKGHIIGILHGDDFYVNNQILSNLIPIFKGGIEAVLGSVWFVPKIGEHRIIRKYGTKYWIPTHFRWGIQPPHPGFFLLKKKYLDLGLYREHFQVAGDFEFLLRGFLEGNWKYYLIHEPIIFMRSGGKSRFSLKNLLLINKECWQACLENNYKIYPAQLLWRYLPKLIGVMVPTLVNGRRFLF
jgi:glycosyltransferase involved in cell wall biosynthesis